MSLIDLSAERDAERQRATLLRFLSHDLRAPHSAILALLDVRPAEDEAGQQVYRQIEQQVRRALGLTDAFVQLAKAESDAYRFEACMFTMLAMDAADQLWPLAQQKDIDLRRDWDDEQEPMVWADPGLLTRALFNLLENAVKYSPAGTVVSLSIRLEGDWLSCRIVDQGKGIAAAELPRLFSQYQRFASAEGSAGLGLGLAMVKNGDRPARRQDRLPEPGWPGHHFRDSPSAAERRGITATGGSRVFLQLALVSKFGRSRRPGYSASRLSKRQLPSLVKLRRGNRRVPNIGTSERDMAAFPQRNQGAAPATGLPWKSR